MSKKDTNISNLRNILTVSKHISLASGLDLVRSEVFVLSFDNRNWRWSLRFSYAHKTVPNMIIQQ